MDSWIILIDFFTFVPFIEIKLTNKFGLSWWFSGKESTCQGRRYKFSPWVGKIPWRTAQQPTPVFLPGESHGQRSLVSYRPRGRRVGHD